MAYFGIDQRKCWTCGTPFNCFKHRHAKTCSPKCRMAMMRIKKAAAIAAKSAAGSLPKCNVKTVSRPSDKVIRKVVTLSAGTKRNK